MASPWTSRVSIIFLFCFPELLLSATVTLESIDIYTSHEWITSSPTVYFKCNGEKETVLPDVKKTQTVYHFKGEESFQPLTDFPSKKCKRCGFYEKDHIKFDHVFDEWEFCPDDFTSSTGRYIHTKAKEFNSTFLCHECVEATVDNMDSDSHNPQKGHGMQWYIAIIVVSIVASVLIIMGLLVAYKYWLKRKRQQEQARFFKLFEDTDDIEDDLGIGPLSDSI